MSIKSTRLKPLLLAGGKSTRVGFPKHLLQMPDGRPLYQHQIDLLHHACPEATTIHVSLGKNSILDSFLQDVAKPLFATPLQSSTAHSEAGAPPIATIFDNMAKVGAGEEPSGPAAGLLAAWIMDPEATWLVVPCNYPRLTVSELDYLRQSYRPPLTCFRDLNGRCDPLLGIWSPEALRELADSLGRGEAPDLSLVAQKMNTLVLDPPEDSREQFKNVSTEAEWSQVLKALGGI